MTLERGFRIFYVDRYDGLCNTFIGNTLHTTRNVAELALIQATEKGKHVVKNGRYVILEVYEPT